MATLGQPHRGHRKRFDVERREALKEEKMDTEEKLPEEQDINLEGGD